MGLSRTVSEVDGGFSRKSQKNFHPVYFTPLLKGFPLELGTGAGVQKTRVVGLPGEGRSLSIFSRLDTIHQRAGQSDGQTDTGRQQRPRLRIASRGNKHVIKLSRENRYNGAMKLLKIFPVKDEYRWRSEETYLCLYY